MSITLSKSMSASLSIANTAKFDDLSWPIRDRRYDLILLRDEKERSQGTVVTGIVSASCSNFNNCECYSHWYQKLHKVGNFL